MDEKRGSIKSILPSSTFSAVVGLSAGAGVEVGFRYWAAYAVSDFAGCGYWRCLGVYGVARRAATADDSVG